MAKEQILYLKALGINLTKTAENLSWAASGETELAESVNCLIDPYGKIKRCAGHTVLHAGMGAVHTLFSKERKFIGVGTFLYESVDGVLLTRKGNCSGNPISIAMHGGTAYCCDGVSLFKIAVDGIVSAWEFTEKKGAVTHRQFAGPMLHSKSTNVFGRVVTLVTGMLVYSEPIGASMFDLVGNFYSDAYEIKEFEATKDMLVVGTEKTVFALVGKDFKEAERILLASKPIITNTLCSGFVDHKEVICFTTADGMYVYTGGEVVKVTEEKVSDTFFKGQQFIGANVVDGRYTVYGATGYFSYTINLATKAFEKHNLQYQKVSRNLGLFTGNVIEFIPGNVTAVSSVSFPALDFGMHFNKSYRHLQVSGEFAGASTWTVSDEAGNQSVFTLPAIPKGSFARIPVSSKVSGKHLQVHFQTSSNFNLESLLALPILKSSRG